MTISSKLLHLSKRSSRTNSAYSAVFEFRIPSIAVASITLCARLNLKYRLGLSDLNLKPQTKQHSQSSVILAQIYLAARASSIASRRNLSQTSSRLLSERYPFTSSISSSVYCAQIMSISEALSHFEWTLSQ